MDIAHLTDLQDWTWETVEELSEQVEGQYLEFKARLPDSTEERRNQEREITAFANGNGGIVVYGVADDGALDPMPKPDHEVEQAVTQLMHNATPLPEIDVSEPIEHPSDETDRIALAVRIYEANRKPVLTSDSAIYIRINDRKEPMSREQIESLFIEQDRRQQAIRQLEIEIDRFFDSLESNQGTRVHEEAPPDYHLLNIESLKEVLRNSPHLYADEEARSYVRSVFQELLWLEDREVYVGRVVNGVRPHPYPSINEFYQSERQKLRDRAKHLGRRLEDLAECLDLQTAATND